MSRTDVLVTADWAQENLGDARHRLRRGRRGHQRLRRRPPRGRRQAGLEERPAGPAAPRLRRQGAASRRCCPREGIGNDDTVVLYGGNNNWFAAYAYWYFKLYGHARRQADRRRPQEVGARRPPAVEGRRRSARPRSTGPQEPDLSIRAFRDEVVASIGSEEPGRRPLARRVLRQDPRPGAPAAGEAQKRRPRPDRDEHPVEQGGQRGRHLQDRRGAGRALRRRRATTRARRPSPTAASVSAPATPGSCCASCSARPTSRTTTAAGSSTARSSASRSRRELTCAEPRSRAAPSPGST